MMGREKRKERVRENGDRGNGDKDDEERQAGRRKKCWLMVDVVALRMRNTKIQKSKLDKMIKFIYELCERLKFFTIDK